ncbi:MAG: hypothetical protein ACTIC2_10155, partial [Enterococcus devriesei]|uniref:hypothetical protein n=1 Tax=Enterococcus devriesei TaxID=319970 RepID=UPI003F91B956
FDTSNGHLIFRQYFTLNGFLDDCRCKIHGVPPQFLFQTIKKDFANLLYFAIIFAYSQKALLESRT